jgi:hypothetical protein
MNQPNFSTLKNLRYNDSPVVLKNFLTNPSQYVTWEDVEDVINSNSCYIELIRNQLKIDIPVFKYFWFAKYTADKKFIIDGINSGDTFIINQYTAFKKQISDLCWAIETAFDVVTDAHVYGGLHDNCKSFKPHIDVPANFICQVEGTTHWQVYKNKCSYLLNHYETNTLPIPPDTLEVDLDVMLEPGDVIYLPSRTFHGAFPKGQRLSISISCKSKDATSDYINLDRNYYKINHV